MDYSMIGKIQKAKEYAEEPERVTFNTLAVEFSGYNNSYTLSLGPDGWHCTCPGFEKYAICPHIMTLERLFDSMLKRERLPYAKGQNVVSDVEKAVRYTKETDRIRFISFDVTIRGSHTDHQVTYDDGQWDCDNRYFQTRGICSHIMVMERLLQNMVERVMLTSSQNGVSESTEATVE